MSIYRSLTTSCLNSCCFSANLLIQGHYLDDKTNCALISLPRSPWDWLGSLFLMCLAAKCGRLLGWLIFWPSDGQKIPPYNIGRPAYSGILFYSVGCLGWICIASPCLGRAGKHPGPIQWPRPAFSEQSFYRILLLASQIGWHELLALGPAALLGLTGLGQPKIGWAIKRLCHLFNQPGTSWHKFLPKPLT